MSFEQLMLIICIQRSYRYLTDKQCPESTLADIGVPIYLMAIRRGQLLNVTRHSIKTHSPSPLASTLLRRKQETARAISSANNTLAEKNDSATIVRAVTCTDASRMTRWSSDL